MLNDKEIGEAIKVWNISEYKNRIPAVCDPVFYLAQRYLSASSVFGEKKTTDNCRSSFDVEKVNIYNSAIDACTFSLMKKCEGLPSVIEDWQVIENEYRPLNCGDDLTSLATAIQEYLMGRDKP